MAKRKPTCELTDRNWDEEEEPEEAGTFKLADQDVLKNRTIRKARRTLTTESGSSAASGGLFAGFALKSSESSISKPSMSTGVTMNFGSNLTFQPKSNGTTQHQDNTSTSLKVNNYSSSTDNPEYLRQLKLLNENILSWIQKHVSKNPYCILTPSFKDYEKHLGDLEGKYASQDSTEIEHVQQAAPATASVFEAAALAAPITTMPCPVKPSANKVFGSGTVFTIGTSSSSVATPSQTAESSDGTEKKGSGFAGFSFGGGLKSSDLGSTESKPFSFALADAQSKPAVARPTDGEDEEYVPPKAEVREIKEDGAVYTRRCKLFYQKSGQWIDRGVGNIHLKPTEDGRSQLIIRADTNLGNILLNILLTKDIPTQRQGKNNVFLVCVPNPPINSKDPVTPTPMLMRVKTGEEADELLAKMEDMKA